jgi:hypothetical protein
VQGLWVQAFLSRYPHNFLQQGVELLGSVDLLCRREGLAPAYLLVQVSIGYVPGRILKLLHCALK